MAEKKEQPVQLIVQNCPTDEDEIDLRELWRTIKKNRKIIFATTTLFFAIALIYIFIKTPIYLIEANIKPGYYRELTKDGLTEVFIQSPQELQIFLNSQYGKKAREQQLPYLKASIDRKAKDIVNLKIYAHSNDEGKKFLDTVLQSITENDNKFITAYKTDIIKKIELNKANIKEIKQEFTALKSQLKNADPKTKKVIFEQITALRSLLMKLEQQNIDLQIKLSPAYIYPTKVIGKVLTEKTSIKPKKKLILTVSVITGLIFGIFMVFFIEFLKSVNEEEQ